MRILNLKEYVLYIMLVILASIKYCLTLSRKKWTVKNIILWAITYIAAGALILVAGAMEITPVVVILFVGAMAWILPFSNINKRRFN